MEQWVIYDHPADYPDHYVVRCWWGRGCFVRSRVE